MHKIKELPFIDTWWVVAMAGPAEDFRKDGVVCACGPAIYRDGWLKGWEVPQSQVDPRVQTRKLFVLTKLSS